MAFFSDLIIDTSSFNFDICWEDYYKHTIIISIVQGFTIYFKKVLVFLLF